MRIPLPHFVYRYHGSSPSPYFQPHNHRAGSEVTHATHHVVYLTREMSQPSPCSSGRTIILSRYLALFPLDSIGEVATLHSLFANVNFSPIRNDLICS
jgi:hypothetical protein